jgi:type VI secretion system secreted protein Hcp
MAFDAFLKIKGIDGESQDDKHKDWIEIMSYSFGASQMSAGSRSSGGMANAERVNVSDFSIVKALDKASPKLFLFCCNGEHIPEISLELCRAGKDKVKYMEYKLTDVAVSSYRPGGSSKGGEPLPIVENKGG